MASAFNGRGSWRANAACAAVAVSLAIALGLSSAAYGHHPRPPDPGFTATVAEPIQGSTSEGSATRSESTGPVAAAAITGCTGPSPNQGSIPIEEDIAVTGEFGKDEEGSYVMVPFDVPVGTVAVRVKYCHDQPAFTNDLNKHTIDMGLYQSRPAGAVWGEAEFRGWGGSSRKDVTVSPEGIFDPPGQVATENTTGGYLPGPVPPGEWAAELGVAAVGTEDPRGEDGKVSWRVEIDLIDDPAFASEPYVPVSYNTAPANPDTRWYAGDVHVHARNSNPNDALMREVFEYAFRPEGAGLDFITLSDYVTTRHWGEIGHFQDEDYLQGKLIVRSAEVITYRGHVNNHASYDFADYRTGPIYEAKLTTPTPPGMERTVESLASVRGERPASAIFDEIHAAGGFTQINHPETFPSEIPTFGNLCRGCSWEYSDAETGEYQKVDAIEVATGPGGLDTAPYPGPNPFTPLAIQFWEEGIDANGLNSNHIAAVGASDSHKAGQASGLPNPSSPIGQATTVVLAPELSEKGIQAGIEAGHTYVKIWGNDGPDVRLCAGPLGADADECNAEPDPGETIMGDTLVAANPVNLPITARVLGAAPSDGSDGRRPGLYTLLLFKDGEPLLEVPISGNDQSFEFPSIGAGRYRIQVMRLATGIASIENVSSPIYLEAAGPPPPPDPDFDDDGVDDVDDNCDQTANPGQEDTDGDGLGDACDGDDDGDNVGDLQDGCPLQPGPASDRGCPNTSRTQRLATVCATELVGTPARDRLVGGPADERLIGRAGADRLLGGGGSDCLEGRKGRDRLDGEAGPDLVLGGRGGDRITAGDGQPDRIHCGRGRDRVAVDATDQILGGCERVRRR